MSGIDRLRTLAGEWDAYGLCGALGDIADQIEREQTDELLWRLIVVQNVVNRMRGVCSDPCSSCSVTSGFVLSWARDLEEALGRRDRAADVSMSAYDLLSKEERPAPKVLDADGVEIRVGDTLYYTETGCKVTVRDINSDGTIELDGHENRGWRADLFAHRAPVLAGDGRPLREGETVWDAESGIEYEVVGIHTDEDSPVRVMRTDGSHLAKAAKPSTLTHERPVADTWERLEEDADKNPFDYCKDVGHRLYTFENSEAYKARDIVRRAKALAERERGE